MKVTVTRATCDRCGGDALDESIRLSIGAREFETELCERHRDMLNARLEPWLSVARGVRPVRTVAKPTRPKRRPVQVVDLPDTVDALAVSFNGGSGGRA
jgi:hypothetical protein